jgi:hypothetical protein
MMIMIEPAPQMSGLKFRYFQFAWVGLSKQRTRVLCW